MARLTQTQIIAALAETSGLKKTEVKGLMDSLADMAVKASDIDVSSSQGVVTLIGRVRSAAMMQDAERIARGGRTAVRPGLALPVRTKSSGLYGAQRGVSGRCHGAAAPVGYRVSYGTGRVGLPVL